MQAAGGLAGPGDAEPIEETWNDVGEIGEVLAAHRRGQFQHLVHARRSGQVTGHFAGQLGVVDHGRRAAVVVQFEGTAIGPGNAFQDGFHPGFHHVPDIGIVGAHRSLKVDFPGYDVEAFSATEDTHGDHAGFQRRQGAGPDRLQGEYDFGRHHDGIDALFGTGAMGLFAPYLDVEMVHGGHGRTNGISDRAHLEGRQCVESEDSLGRGIFEDFFPHHQVRSTLFARWRPFLCRLEYEFDRAGQVGLHVGQHGSHAQLYGRMHVMAAGVHDAHFLAEIGRPHGRFEG